MGKGGIEKGKIRKIRDAVRELAETFGEMESKEAPSKSNLKEALRFFKELNKEDKEEAGDQIKGLATERYVRLKMGPERWNVFVSVGVEKWAEIKKRGREEFKQKKKDVENIFEERMLKKDIHSRAMHDADIAIAEDPRIRAAFAGKESLLTEGMKLSEKMRPYYESMFMEDEPDE